MDIIAPQDGRPTEDLDPMDVLVGGDGNAFAVIGRTTKALRRAGATQEYIAAFQKEATSGDYDHLLATAVVYLESRPL